MLQHCFAQTKHRLVPQKQNLECNISPIIKLWSVADDKYQKPSMQCKIMEMNYFFYVYAL